MADRNDITVVQDVDPRYAEIAAPSTEIVMQDYVDTLRGLEDDFQNMSFPYLLDASGKEDLGGGTLVAITVEEQNIQIAFEPRFTPAATGTVTTASGPPDQRDRQTFVDTGADFVSAGIQPGSYLINWTDRSVTDVARVIDSTTLETRALSQGTDNDFDVSDDYSIWNITQVRTTGGNLVAVDEGGSSISAILPTWGTQVILTTSSSATLQELTEIRYAAYQNAVWYDAGSSNSGTDYPNGTPFQPVNNFQDVRSIADTLGFINVRLLSDATLDTGDDLTDLTVVASDPSRSTVTINSGATVPSVTFLNVTVTGVLDGGDVITDCVVLPTLDFIEGTLKSCLLEAGTISLNGTADVNLLNCWSGVAGTSTPILDYNGSGRDLNIRNYSGGIEIRNKTGADSASVELDGGHLILDSTVTAGTIKVYGTGQLTNNSTGTTVVDTTGFIEASKLLTTPKFIALKGI